MKKMIKTIFAGGFALSCGVVAVTNVSCGKNNSPTVKTTFDAFKTSAEAESIVNIVAQTHPNGWDALPDDDLTKDDSKVVDKTIVIVISSKSKIQTASFTATYIADTAYNIQDWICTRQPSGPVSWATFKTSGANDANNVMTSHSSFGVTNYWGTIGISKEETDKLVANFMKNITNNIDSNNNLKTDINGAFEEPFDSDNTNTIAMAFITGKKGESLTQVYADSNIIFNSWDNKNYDTKNWNNHDDSPNYTINKFYENLKTDQGELIKIFSKNTGDSAKGLKYQGTNKLTMQSLTSNSHLILNPSSLNKNQLSDDKLFPITTTYTLSMTASDNTSNIVNIKSNFLFKKGDTIPTTTNITTDMFSHTTTTSALSPTDVKSELRNFLAMKDITGKSTFDEAWRTQITYQAPSSQKQLLNAKSITIGNVSDTGEISIAVVDPNGTTVNLTTTATISNGFSGINNPNEAYARFIKANYGFSDQNKWDSGQDLANTMLSIFKLKLAS